MRNQIPFAKTICLAITLFMFGFGTQASAQVTTTWISTFSTTWNDAGNWNNGIPGANDHVILNDGASIVLGSATTIGSLELTGGAAVSFTANGILTVAGASTLAAGAQLNLGDGSAAYALQLNGAITFAAGGANHTKIYSSSAVLMKVVKLGSTATLTMGDLRTTYFGLNVNVWIERATGLLQSDVRFNDDITAACEFNPGAYNVWLGKDADILRSSYNNQNQKFITFTSQTSATGMVIKDVAYWKNSSGYDLNDTNLGFFEFAVGASKVAAIRLDINYVREYDLTTTPTWSPSATEPFRGVGVRAVNLVHPENTATNSYSFYWVVQPIGVDQDNYDNQTYDQFDDYVGPPNNICFEVEFHPGYIQGSPQHVQSARYTDNYEDVLSGGAWFTDGSSPTPTSASGRVFVGQCVAVGFGDITIAVGDFGGDPTPVELTSFSARYIDNSVRLSWNTATELNNYGFAIERSLDAENWEEVGFVPGYGTSSSPKSYLHIDKLTDNAAYAPQLAYRLRQIDRDGTTDYSNIVFVKTSELPSGVELYAAYPNPFNPATTISFTVKESANVNLKVYNTFGQEVAILLSNSAMDAGLHTVSFNGEKLPSGVYMAVLEVNGELQQQKLVLNK